MNKQSDYKPPIILDETKLNKFPEENISNENLNNNSLLDKTAEIPKKLLSDIPKDENSLVKDKQLPSDKLGKSSKELYSVFNNLFRGVNQKICLILFMIGSIPTGTIIYSVFKCPGETLPLIIENKVNLTIVKEVIILTFLLSLIKCRNLSLYNQ